MAINRERTLVHGTNRHASTVGPSGDSYLVTTAATGASNLSIFVYILVRQMSAPGNFTITDTKGNTYTLDRSQGFTPSGGGNVGVLLFSAHGATALTNGAGDMITLNWNGSEGVDAVAMCAVEYSGLLTPGSQVDIGHDANDGGVPGTAPASGSATTAGAHDLLVGLIGFGKHNATDPAITDTPGGSYTSEGQLNVKDGGAGLQWDWMSLDPLYRIVAATGSYSASGTLSASADWGAIFQAYTADPLGLASATAGIGVSASATHSATATARIGLSATASGSPIINQGSATANIGVNAHAAPTVVHPGSARAGIGLQARFGRLYELFNDLGLLIGRINMFGSIAASNMPQGLLKIENNFVAREDIEGLFAAWSGYQGSFTGLRQSLAAFADVRVLDQKRVQSPLRLNGASQDDVFEALGFRMIEDAVTINRSTATIGTLVPDARNHGNGTVLLTATLDGAQPPLIGAASHPWYAGLASELVVPSEIMSLVCTADSQGGTQEGGETFLWSGSPSGDVLDWQQEGSGGGPTVTVAGGDNVIANGDFERGSSSGISGWSILSGTFGTHVKRDQSTFYRGTSSLLLVGDGTTTITVAQNIARSLTTLRQYGLAIRLLAGGNPAGATLTIGFTGTGYVAKGSEQIVITSANFPFLNWLLQNCWIIAPDPVPSNFSVQVSVTSLQNGMNIWLDDVLLKDVDYHGGLGLVTIPGNIPFLEGDRFEWIASNNGVGVFQEFIRRYWRTQLNSSVSPSISDSLAS